MNEGTRIRGLITKSYDRRLREATGSDADWLVELDVVFVRTLRPAMAEIGAELTRAGHACQIQSGHVEGMPSLDWTVEPRGAAEGKRMIRVFPRKDERKGWEILAEVWLSGTPRELTRSRRVTPRWRSSPRGCGGAGRRSINLPETGGTVMDILWIVVPILVVVVLLALFLGFGFAVATMRSRCRAWGRSRYGPGTVFPGGWRAEPTRRTSEGTGTLMCLEVASIARSTLGRFELADKYKDTADGRSTGDPTWTPVRSGGGGGGGGGEKIEPEVAYQAAGRVTRAQGALFAVCSGSAEYQARRATSCLLEPHEGDVVLLSIVPRRATYVVAVLEREEGDRGGAARVALEGDLELQVPNGRVVIAAKDGVDLVSTSAVRVTSDELKVTRRAAEVVIEHLGVVGGTVQAQLRKVKVVAETIDQAADRVVQRFKRAYRFVAEMDQTRAQRIDIAAEKTMSLHAENAVVTAQELVKVDGSQIHMG